MNPDRTLVVPVLLTLLISITLSATPKALPTRTEVAPHDSMYTKWVAKVIREISQVKEGMNRSDLDNFFTQEGGLSSRTYRRYVYKQCPYIKVDVQFSPVGKADGESSESPNDKIIRMSKPFLEWSNVD